MLTFKRFNESFKKVVVNDDTSPRGLISPRHYKALIRKKNKDGTFTETEKLFTSKESANKFAANHNHNHDITITITG